MPSLDLISGLVVSSNYSQPYSWIFIELIYHRNKVFANVATTKWLYIYLIYFKSGSFCFDLFGFYSCSSSFCLFFFTPFCFSMVLFLSTFLCWLETIADKLCCKLWCLLMEHYFLLLSSYDIDDTKAHDCGLIVSKLFPGTFAARALSLFLWCPLIPLPCF